MLEWARNQHRRRRLPQDPIDIRSEQSENPKAGALGADAYQIDFVSLRIMDDLAIRLSFTNDILNLAPKVGFVGHGSLQPASGLVIDALTAQRVPGNFRFVKSEWRQDIQEVQFRLVLLRNRQT